LKLLLLYSWTDCSQENLIRHLSDQNHLLLMTRHLTGDRITFGLTDWLLCVLCHNEKFSFILRRHITFRNYFSWENLFLNMLLYHNLTIKGIFLLGLYFTFLNSLTKYSNNV
jgi:hypothetical protein